MQEVLPGMISYTLTARCFRCKRLMTLELVTARGGIRSGKVLESHGWKRHTYGVECADCVRPVKEILAR